MKNFLRTTSVITGLALLLAGCGTSGGGEQQPAGGNAAPAGNQAAEPNLLDQIKAEGKIKIGTEGTYSPFTFHDPSGQLTGFDVDVATEVAKRMGVEPVFMETQWDAMFAGLDSKRFDLIANEVGIRPDRQEKYDFSEPYSASQGVLVVHKDNNEITDFSQIKGLKAAQTLTSNWSQKAKDSGAQIVATETLTQAVDLVATKRVDVVINDALSVYDYLKQKPDMPVKVVAKYDTNMKNGFMFRKGNPELIEAVNKAIDEMIKDGTYQKISEKWFGVNILE
ncbi:amino acid ABC transporter substrate-binding protein [Brevibacillus sp. B_LB10_24]|uniref:amino acid ABC transporter substrate-binding protein n=1 Tax=Brevibacillus sp. B_LB10_24 TaxID=3380645 RepID=UPI0038BDA53D